MWPNGLRSTPIDEEQMIMIPRRQAMLSAIGCALNLSGLAFAQSQTAPKLAIVRMTSAFPAGTGPDAVAALSPRRCSLNAESRWS